MNGDQLPAAWGGTVPLPEPGVYPGIEADTYHQWPAASSSRLSRLLQSPAHMRAYIEEPPKDTPALILGRAIHAAVLEPDEFRSRFLRGPEGDRRTKAVKEAWADMELGNPGASVLRPADFDTCIAARDAVWAKSTAAALLGGEGDAELSLVWTDDDSGAACKARLDRHSPKVSGGAIVDLKTTRSADPREFERSIFSFNYHAQAGLYLMGTAAHDLPIEHYTIIALEKEPPYGVAVYRLTDGAVTAGEEQVRTLLQLYAKCEREQEWPDYPDIVRDVSIPDWAWSVVDERVARIGEEAA